VTVLRLRRNFGQTAALSAGFDAATGDVVCTMDGDLQNDPRDIPRLLDKLNEGYDVVSGWRINRIR
jgi:glycosyltransferase involved in cell wall biosynthesis